jgi:hypothetical protein
MDTLQLDQFRSVLRQSRHIVAVAGAGLSAASGMPVAHIVTEPDLPTCLCICLVTVCIVY